MTWGGSRPLPNPWEQRHRRTAGGAGSGFRQKGAAKRGPRPARQCHPQSPVAWSSNRLSVVAASGPACAKLVLTAPTAWERASSHTKAIERSVHTQKQSWGQFTHESNHQVSSHIKAIVGSVRTWKQSSGQFTHESNRQVSSHMKAIVRSVHTWKQSSGQCRVHGATSQSTTAIIGAPRLKAGITELLARWSEASTVSLGCEHVRIMMVLLGETTKMLPTLTS